MSFEGEVRQAGCVDRVRVAVTGSNHHVRETLTGFLRNHPEIEQPPSNSPHDADVVICAVDRITPAAVTVVEALRHDRDVPLVFVVLRLDKASAARRHGADVVALAGLDPEFLTALVLRRFAANTRKRAMAPSGRLGGHAVHMGA